MKCKSHSLQEISAGAADVCDEERALAPGLNYRGLHY